MFASCLNGMVATDCEFIQSPLLSAGDVIEIYGRGANMDDMGPGLLTVLGMTKSHVAKVAFCGAQEPGCHAFLKK